jgi:hypothetical protein
VTSAAGEGSGATSVVTSAAGEGSGATSVVTSAEGVDCEEVEWEERAIGNGAIVDVGKCVSHKEKHRGMLECVVEQEVEDVSETTQVPSLVQYHHPVMIRK